MLVEQEPKYDVNAEGRIFNRATGQVIPDDEPVMIFRARDKHAIQALMYYANHCVDPAHVAIVDQRIDDFRAFRKAHPDRMKEPDSPA